ncbi:MAG: CoA transferase [Minwuia sp.]|nr:CoA transferase [Minwuia sp.]
MSGPLEGLKVLDIATIVAAPFTATLLADYGADVVKVEMPGPGDGLRSFPPFKDGKGLWWKVANRGKRFVTLDLRKPEGRDMMISMLPEFDVLIENFRPGTLDRWGLDRDTLWGANKSLVILRATAFGQTGPYSHKPGFARIFEAMSGLAYMSGDEDRSPMHNGYPIGDAIGGLFGAVSVLTALLSRARSGATDGEEIDLSLTEATYRLLDNQIIQYDQTGIAPERTGNRSQYSAPANVYATSDGQYVTLSGSTQATFKANARAIDRPELLEDERFTTNPERFKHQALLDQIFGDWFASHTQEEALAAFERETGTLAPIYSAEQIVNDPQFQSREAVISVPDADYGEVRMQGIVPKFRNNPGAVRHPGKDIGADNADVYGKLLGLDADALAELKDKGVI